MNFSISKAVLTLALLCSSNLVRAQIFDIEITDWGGINNQTLRDFVNTQIDKIKTDLNKDLPNGSPDRLLEGMANSSAMAGKGIGTDYTSSMDVFVIGLGVGAAADLEKNKEYDSDLSGIGVAPGVMLGMNLGFMDARHFLGMETNRLNWFVNFMSYTHDQEMGKEDKPTDLNLKMLAFGTHLRYDLVRPSGPGLLRWGGFKFTFGFEYNATTTTFTSKIKETISETTSNGEVIHGTIEGSPKGIIESTTMSIPIALSTDLRLFYILSIYTGVGADYNMGKATGKGDLNGTESTLDCDTGGLCDPTAQQIRVRPIANLDSEGKVTPFTFRAFAGAQINLPIVKIFAQVDKSLTNEVMAATAGIRLAF